MIQHHQKMTGASLATMFLTFILLMVGGCCGLPEELLSTPELIKYWGYPSEVHNAVTTDGYVLTLHRIPHGRTNSKATKGVFFLQHTLLTSSADWVMNLPNQSLAFVLADKGYDVWMGNVRGNCYSKKHAKIKVDSDKFWDFSTDEMAQKDIPAMIDYVLEATHERHVYYVGHSQGSMVLLAALSENTDLANKIKVNFALAPISRMNHVKGMIEGISTWGKQLEYVFKFFHIREFYSSSKWSRRIMMFLCKLTPHMCKWGISIFNGKSGAINATRTSVYMAHTPAGTSTKTILHYSQMINSGKFNKYDYGKLGNMERYGTPHPPEYDLSKVRVPTVVFSGTMDNIAPPKDVAWTTENLGLVLKSFYARYNHLDFVWGMSSGTFLYDNMKWYC